MLDIQNLVSRKPKHTRYKRQLERINAKNGYTENIEKAVDGAVKNVDAGCRSFVIYGEPQSGKTEMMIALTARLLDYGFKIIVVLLNDNVQLLTQNLERFRRSSIDPAPKNYTEIIDPLINIKDSECIIFSKKNSRDLKQLINKIGNVSNKVILDDEADYATPNSKVNRGEKTKINELVEKLIGKDGVYIGVTATPARLDLNNTFRNENEKWVDFPAHPYYKGQSTFFPTSIDGNTLDFNLNLLPDTNDTPKYLRDAVFSFLINVAYLNLTINVQDGEKNYSMLIHTSGKTADHTKDNEEVIKIFNILSKNDPADDKFKKYFENIYKMAVERYPGQENELVEYIYANRNRSTIIVMNSNADKKAVDYTSATDPSSLFTIAIGGNIVSRGVTFDNLLSMFFTRDVKHKMQQDTYIQRARMFGSRGKYLSFFDLHIPEQLYLDWHRCFVFHKLSLDSIRSGNGSPVWLEDRRVGATANGSVDKTTVSFDSGEMSFEIFNYSENIQEVINGPGSNYEKLTSLSIILGKDKFPSFLLEWVRNFSPDDNKSIMIHNSTLISENYSSADVENLTRPKGFMSTTEIKREKGKRNNSVAIHHFRIFYNSKGKARIFYKYDGNIRFVKNLRKNTHD